MQASTKKIFQPFVLLLLYFISLSAWCQTVEEEDVTVVVTARQWEEPLQEAPQSVTVLPSTELESAGIHTINDATPLVPNVTLPDFTARWLSFPFVRGIGSGRNAPAVTTIIDGVPQLSFATTNQELLDVERIEFLRGPHGSLYGRNTLGGVISVVQSQPLETHSTYAVIDAGNYGLTSLRGGTSGPLGNSYWRGGVSVGSTKREGFSVNDFNGHRLDDRDALYGRAQAVWNADEHWTLRMSANAESDRDGSYALSDLAGLRARPHHVAYDYEGFTHRDLAQPVFSAVRQGESTDFTSITALQRWQINESTDLDATPLDLLRRGNAEDQQAWTQDFRLTSRADEDNTRLRWLVGLFAFTSDKDQLSSTEYRPDAVSMLGAPLPFTQFTGADLHDTGVSPYGQVNVTLSDHMEVTAGLRHDFEHRSALLRDFTDPVLGPPTAVEASRDFNQTSPQISFAYHLTPDVLWYTLASSGYKTGGFNAQAPPGETIFDEETSWTYETGVKTTWNRGRLIANLSLFHTAWNDIQLDVPTAIPAVFYIDNAGRAVSRGAEVEVIARPMTGMHLFADVGLLDTAFRSGSQSAGVDVSDNDLPFAPRLTWHAGARMSHRLSSTITGFARADITHTGSYFYDAGNQASQESYTLANLRLGAEHGDWRADIWARNLFNADYIPVAFPFPLAPSGYIGESGAPRTFGLSLGYTLR